jgi:hypothetical protein
MSLFSGDAIKGGLSCFSAPDRFTFLTTREKKLSVEVVAP